MKKKQDREILLICMKYFSAIVIPDWDKKSFKVNQEWYWGVKELEELFKSRLDKYKAT